MAVPAELTSRCAALHCTHSSLPAACTCRCVFACEVGYGDIAPRSDAGRAFCIPWMVLSAMTATRIIGDVTNVYMTWNRNQRAKAVLKNSVQCQLTAEENNCIAKEMQRSFAYV